MSAKLCRIDREPKFGPFLTRAQKKQRWAATDVSVGQRDGLHEVHSLGKHLDQGEDVAGFDRVAQCVQPGR